MKFFSNIVSAIEGVFSDIKDHFHAAVAWSQDELKQAEQQFLSGVEADAVSIGQAFEAGANWALSRAKDAVQTAVQTHASGDTEQALQPEPEQSASNEPQTNPPLSSGEGQSPA